MAAAFSWSQHAKQRRRLMGLTEHKVEAVLANPALTYTSPYHGRDYTYYVGNGLCIPVDSDGWIVTLLWHGRHGRNDDGSPM